MTTRLRDDNVLKLSMVVRDVLVGVVGPWAVTNDQTERVREMASTIERMVADNDASVVDVLAEVEAWLVEQRDALAGFTPSRDRFDRARLAVVLVRAEVERVDGSR